MKKFKFRLERVLQYRETIKQEKQKILMKKNLELQSAEEKFSNLEDQFLQNRPTEGSMSIDELVLKDSFAIRITREMEEQRKLIIEIEQEVEIAKEEYFAAVKDVKALETLKERKFREFEEVVAKVDEKFLDELSTQKGNAFGAGEK